MHRFGTKNVHHTRTRRVNQDIVYALVYIVPFIWIDVNDVHWFLYHSSDTATLVMRNMMDKKLQEQDTIRVSFRVLLANLLHLSSLILIICRLAAFF